MSSSKSAVSKNGNGRGHGVSPPNGQNSDFHSSSLEFVEGLYQTYLRDPEAVDLEWRDYFSKFAKTAGSESAEFSPPVVQRSIFNPPEKHVRPQTSQVSVADTGHQERLDQLIRNYRVRGHILAEIDPLGQERGNPPELRPEFYGFTEEDYDRNFSTSWFAGPENRTLRSMMQWLKMTYCRSIGVQFMHIDSLRVREWLQTRMETTGNRIKLTRAQQIQILKRLSDAVIFEEFIQKKFLGQKRFSLEGAETLIPLLDLAIEKAGQDGIREIVFAMAHRGRLNVLANILSKNPRTVFREFSDKDPELHMGRGDVKYHLGYSNDWVSASGNKIHLSMCFNPSHLEFINPVALGRIRAKQDRYHDTGRQHGLTIQIHGDAAFAGEGIVQETLNLSELPGYATGGSLHIIVNNQLGFTTSPHESRSCTYATDVAKMLQIPIFHVNGEDPEAVAQVVNLALDFRKTFRRDVVIDMYCFRKYGHNESDEPEFTQPVLYKQIKSRPSVYTAYREHLRGLRGITEDEADAITAERRSILEHEFEAAQKEHFIRCIDEYGGVWTDYFGGHESEADVVETGVPVGRLREYMTKVCTVPQNFTPHPKVRKLLDARLEMVKGNQPIDWGAGEMMAFASLVADGYPFRMSGQDVCRGTFSHRHATIYDYESGQPHLTLKRVAQPGQIVEMHNSPLSEAGVLAFEYGYSLDTPEGATIWEAQFGDFSNAAQVIIDQFITSAEDKWHRYSSLMMFLPHGFEGQGPEHSSARLERYLMQAAEDNIQIINPTTPAQHFHMIRRQVLRKWKKPLIVMTPKSLLRHPEATSSLARFEEGTFQTVIPDRKVDKETCRRVVMCSGKIYYELLKHRAEHNHHDVSIIRLEQLYPIPFARLEQILGNYEKETEVMWVQEEPENMGASRFLRAHLGHRLFDRHPFTTVERRASASPATGSAKSHAMEQQVIMEKAFADVFMT